MLHSARSLLRTPTFTALVVLTLALALGANTAVLSIANAALFRPVPGVPDSNDLLLVQFEKPDGNGTGTSWPNFVDLTEDAADLADFTTFAVGGYDLRPEVGPPITVRGEAVPTGYFTFLGVRAALGRLPAEDAEGGTADRWIVLSERLWETLYGRDPGTLGQSVYLNGQPFRIVGVTDEYRGATRQATSDVFFPLGFYPELRFPGGEYTMTGRSFRALFQFIARRAPGAEGEQIEERLRQGMARLVSAFPGEIGIHEEYVPTVYVGIGISTWARVSTSRTMAILGLIVALVLLIACANVASLLIARGIARRGDTAVRRALGAAPGRIVGEHVTEGLLLALPAAALGLVVARALTSFLAGLSAGNTLLDEIPPLDGRVLGFTLLVTIVTGVALRCSRSAWTYAPPLVDASRQTSGGPTYVRSGLTIVQVALSLVLIIGASLLSRTLRALNATDLGFEASGCRSWP